MNTRQFISTVTVSITKTYYLKLLTVAMSPTECLLSYENLIIFFQNTEPYMLNIREQGTKST